MKKIIAGIFSLLFILSFTACELGPVEITEIYLAKEERGDLEEVKNFEPQDDPFYCIVNLSHAPEGTKVKAVWTAVDIPSADMEDEEIDSYKETINDGETELQFTLELGDDWPEGKYNVEIFIDGESHESIDFKVK